MKKSKWINTRYAKPYKNRVAFKMSQMAQISAIGAMQNSSIMGSHSPIACKTVAVALNTVKTAQALSVKSKEVIKGRLTE